MVYKTNDCLHGIDKLVRHFYDCNTERLFEIGDGLREVKIARKPLSILIYLKNNSDRIVSVNELMDNIWPDTIVTKGSVKDYIHTLRSVLDNDDKALSYIETIRGKGYRFRGRIENVEFANTPNSVLAESEKPRVGLLRFSGNHINKNIQLNNMCISLNSSISTHLSRFSSLNVVCGDIDVVQMEKGDIGMKSVARTLNAAYLSFTTISIHVNIIRIHSKLVIADSSEVIWSDSFSASISSFSESEIDLSRRISVAIENRIRLHRSDSAARKSIETMSSIDYVLLADKIISDNIFDYRKARSLYQIAIDLDPDSDRALCGLAMSYAEETSCNPGPMYEQALSTGLQLALTAISKNRYESKTHKTLGFIYAGMGDKGFATREFKKAIDINPCDADSLAMFGINLGFNGRSKLGVRYMYQAINLCRFTPDWYFWRLGNLNYLSGDYGVALRNMEAFSALNATVPMPLMAATHSRLKNYKKAAEIVDKIEHLVPGYSVSVAHTMFKRVNQECDADRVANDMIDAGFSI